MSRPVGRDDMLLKKSRVLLIGGGLTSSLLSLLIGQHKNLSQLVQLHIWEVGSGLGGRFATFASPRNQQAFVDLGAQYLTHTKGHDSKIHFDALLQAGLLREMDTSGIPGFKQDDSKLHYACTQGTTSVVQYFFDQTKGSRDMLFNRNVNRLTLVKLQDRSKIQVWSNASQRELFDVVISTIPVPQLLEMDNVSNILKENPGIDEDLRKVVYSSRYAMSLFYSKPLQLEENTEAIHFVSDPNSPIRYWSIEPVKRSGIFNSTEPGSIIAHAAVGFGEENSTEDPEFEDTVRTAVQEQIQPLQLPPYAYSKLHHWKYSQVTTPYPGKPGCIRLSDDPLLIATGDGFTASGFEGCLAAAQGAFLCLYEQFLK